jgi:hypothetical protein
MDDVGLGLHNADIGPPGAMTGRTNADNNVLAEPAQSLDKGETNLARAVRDSARWYRSSLGARVEKHAQRHESSIVLA